MCCSAFWSSLFDKHILNRAQTCLVSCPAVFAGDRAHRTRHHTVSALLRKPAGFFIVRKHEPEGFDLLFTGIPFTCGT